MAIVHEGGRGESGRAARQKRAVVCRDVRLFGGGAVVIVSRFAPRSNRQGEAAAPTDAQKYDQSSDQEVGGTRQEAHKMDRLLVPLPSSLIAQQPLPEEWSLSAGMLWRDVTPRR